MTPQERSMIPHTVAATALLTASIATAQTAPPTLSDRVLQVNSGMLHNNSTAMETVFSRVISDVSASSMQLRFGRTNLSPGTVLRLTSLADGATQHHTAKSLAQWSHHSAWFNGPHVLIELIMPPDANPSHLTVDRSLSMVGVFDDRSICYGTDDRVLSYDDRSGRVAPIGCTGWLIDDPARQFLTAGHCVNGSGYAEIMEFNVPLSNGDGSWNHPGPEDQYPVDPVSIQFTDDGVGDDWCYYGCFPNTETGLTAFEVQGVTHVLANAAPAVDGRDITITGYGSTSAPVSPTWYGVQKTHTGPYMHNSGWNVGYQTDTTGGNSGSPVLDEVTGMAIGIHTHAGCYSDGGYNNGTAIEHPDLQYALANPLGVCIPNILNISIMTDVPEAVLPASPFTLTFSVVAGDEDPDPNSVRVVLTRNGEEIDAAVSAIGKDMYSAEIPGFACGDDVQWYIEANSKAGSVVTSPLDAPDTQFTLLIGELTETIIFAADFENGLPSGWSASGLWHAASTACVGPSDCGDGGVMYFGQDSQCHYDTNSSVSGLLTSPAISLAGLTGPYELSYCSHLQTESNSSYDFALVTINGVEVERAPEGGWTNRTLEIDTIAGDSATVTFSFDSIDDFFNEYSGWHIEGVQLVARGIDCTDPEPCDADIDGDGFVGTDDLLHVIADWGSSQSKADVDGDGIVGTNDLLAVIAAWGSC